MRTIHTTTTEATRLTALVSDLAPRTSVQIVSRRRVGPPAWRSRRVRLAGSSSSAGQTRAARKSDPWRRRRGVLARANSPAPCRIQDGAFSAGNPHVSVRTFLRHMLRFGRGTRDVTDNALGCQRRCRGQPTGCMALSRRITAPFFERKTLKTSVLTTASE